MATKHNIGSTQFSRIGARSNVWTRQMNDNMIRATMLFNPAVESRTDTLPESAAEGAMWIDPVNNKLSMWMDSFDENIPGVTNRVAGYMQLQALPGQLVYVKDEAKYYMMNHEGVWEFAIDIDAVHVGVEREFSFYAPYRIRPTLPVFQYVAGLEFTIEAGAPNSGAHLDVAPTGGSLVFQIIHNSTVVGSITFAAGSQTGVISFPSERIIQPSHVENMYVQANVLTINAPADTLLAEGLSLTLRGKIRAID